jgi:hypothetical protein
MGCSPSIEPSRVICEEADSDSKILGLSHCRDLLISFSGKDLFRISNKQKGHPSGCPLLIVVEENERGYLRWATGA